MATLNKKDLVIGLDLGTTTTKAIAMDVDGAVAATAKRKVKLNAPQLGWATQSPQEYGCAVDQVLGELTDKIDVKRATGICLSGAMHSIIPIGTDNQPLAQGMTWADKRGNDQIAELLKQIDTQALHQRTGCPARALYHPARLRWWKQNQGLLLTGSGSSAVDFDMVRFVSMKEWIIFRLTGQWVCDTGFASTTGLLKLQTRNWDKQALSLAGINENQLSKLVEPNAIIEPGADALSTVFNIPVIPGSTDGPLANLGAAGTTGNIVLTVGTSAAVRRTVNRPTVDRQQQGWCYLIADEFWAQGGAINNGGMTAQWVADLCYQDVAEDQRFKVLGREADEAGPGAGGVNLLPYFAGERTPVWDADASASIHGLKRWHTRGHIARAGLEAVAFCLRDVWEIIIEGSKKPVAPASSPRLKAHGQDAHGAEHKNLDSNQTVFLTGGITSSPVWCQIVADVLGVSIDPCQVADGSAIGAARLGHWALGNIAHLKNFPAQPCDDAIKPYAVRHQQYERAYERFKNLKKEKGFLHST